QQMPEGPPLTAANFPLTHLWFLYLLLLLYAGMLVLRLPLVVVDRGGHLREALSGFVLSLLRMEVLVLLLGGVIAVSFLQKADWVEWFGVPTPDYGFVPNTQALVTYGLAFTLGWVLHRQIQALDMLRRRAPFYLLLAGALTAGCLALLDGKPSTIPVLDGQMKVAYAAAYGLAIWYWSLGLVGAALALFPRENASIRYLADSSYWLYLIHLPLVMALQVWVMKWPWPAEAKYMFILGTSVPLMLLSYQFLVRNSFIGVLLNGRKKGR
ncbi:MAG: acyltransferase family protein, partial [Pseudomonadota bacterium]